MRVALISTPFLSVPPRDYGGTELIVYELAEGLASRGHSVTLFATGDSRTSAELRWYYDRPQWPPQVIHDLEHVSWAMREVADGAFDVVHAHSSVALSLTRFVTDVPMVYTVHHEREEQLSALYAAHPSVQYVAISADQRAREVPLPRFEIIHHGLDPSQYECAPSGGDYVCFVGRLAPVKGPHTAIDVARAAGVPIRVAGEVHPPDREFGDTEMAWRLTMPHVDFVGCVGLEQKRPLLRDARALLAPIAWNEPFGLILIEAMLSGCPVVAYPRGSVPELVEHGVTGFIVRSAEEMADVIRREGPVDAFDRLRCRARAVERFAAERMVAKYEQLYHSVIGQAAFADTIPAA